MHVPSPIPNLSKMQAALSQVADSASMLWKTDAEDFCFYVNQNASAHSGHLHGVRLTAWARFIHPEDYPRVVPTFRNAKKTRAAYKIEYRIVKNDGTVRWMMSSALPRFDEKGQFDGYDGTTVDVTDRYDAAERLAKSEAAYRLLADSSTDLITHYDAGGTILYASPSYTKVLGYESANLTGTNVYALLHPDDAVAVQKKSCTSQARIRIAN